MFHNRTWTHFKQITWENRQKKPGHIIGRTREPFSITVCHCLRCLNTKCQPTNKQILLGNCNLLCFQISNCFSIDLSIPGISFKLLSCLWNAFVWHCCFVGCQKIFTVSCEVAFLKQLGGLMFKLWLFCEGQFLNADVECLLVLVGFIVMDSKWLKLLGEAMIQKPSCLQGQGGVGGCIQMLGNKSFHQLRITEACG